jgi:hypothetical protein
LRRVIWAASEPVVEVQTLGQQRPGLFLLRPYLMPV